MQILLICIVLLKLFITPVRKFKMADGDKHDCPSRRFSSKEALQMILATDLYSSDSSTDCYYSHESSSEDELPSATQRKRSKFEGPTKNQTVNNNTMATNNNELCDSNWKDVSTIENDNRKFEFRFIPAKKTGVCADITSNSTPLDCLFTLLTDDIMEDIVIMINIYAIHKIQLNSPARRRSTYNDWKPTNRYDLLKFIAVLIAMGLDHRPSIKDYWSALPIYHSTFYKEMFTRPRFEFHWSM